jgi:hypothetical protein
MLTVVITGFFLSLAISFIAALLFKRVLAAIPILLISIGVLTVIVILYFILLWFFRLDSVKTIGFTNDGVRETVNEREITFIPWAGIKEVEVTAAVLAGASLRIRASFSEIAFDNDDITIKESNMHLRKIHSAMRDLTEIKSLINLIREKAPTATISMSRLASKRFDKQD